MSDSENILVTIALTDRHLSHQMVQKIKSQFARLPLEINLVDDGKRAWSDFQAHHPVIVIAGADLPSMSGLELIKEIQKVDGSTGLLLLKQDQSQVSDGIDSIDLPIVDWTSFLNKFQGLIPDDWKAKFGLFDRNSALYQKLVEYGKRYRSVTENLDENSDHLVCIPNFFDQGSSGKEFRPKNSSAQSEKIIFRELSKAQLNKVLVIELVLLAGLTLVTAFLYSGKIGFGEDSFFSIRSLMAAVTGFSYFGFFLGRGFDRYILSKQIK